jgi:hypothetical protein
MTLKVFVGSLIGQQIDDWDETYKELNSQNYFDEKVVKEIVIELCKRVEALEVANK